MVLEDRADSVEYKGHTARVRVKGYWCRKCGEGILEGQSLDGRTGALHVARPMPILQGTITFARFRVELPKGFDARRTVPKGLRARAFEPIDVKRDDDRAVGFVELENSDATAFEVGNLFYGEHALFAFRVDTLRVPSKAVKTELERWQVLFEKENARKPSRSEKAEAKENVRHMLRKRATPTSKVFDVSWNLKTGRLEVFASSRKLVEEIQAAIQTAASVELLPMVPEEHARRLGIAEEALGPTPALIGAELDLTTEVASHVQA